MGKIDSTRGSNTQHTRNNNSTFHCASMREQINIRGEEKQTKEEGVRVTNRERWLAGKVCRYGVAGKVQSLRCPLE